MEVKTLTGQLADPARAAKTKLEAAELLLTRTYPEAVAALKDFLSKPSNPSAQIAVAEAIARYSGSQKEFVDPLVQMLTGKDESVRPSAARALANYKDPLVMEKLVSIALDSRLERSVRLSTIAALWQVLEKNTVDALVRLLDDPDESIRGAASEALAKLTNIEAFRTNRNLARQWWARNRHKDRSQWLADLADSLAKANAALESDNTQLRDRLARAMQELYAATPSAQRGAMLLGFLKDPLADVRLVGLTLAEGKIAANEEVPAEIRNQVRSMLADADPRVRKASALLVANLGDGEALVSLLDRLKAEDVPSVREGLLTALGQLRDPKALPAALAQIRSRDDSVAAAAAEALARIVSQKPLQEDQRNEAARTLVARYRQMDAANDVPALREALMAAMGAVRDKDFLPILQDALHNSAATVRLAAVNALAQFAQADLAATLVGLISDPDRGVRRAAIAAVGTLGGQRYLQTVLKQTDPQVEGDAAVRQQAWDVAMGILAKADPKVLASVAQALADRTDAANQRIKVLQMLVGALKAAKSEALPSTLRELGLALMKASRPAEAAPVFAEAQALLLAEKSPQAQEVWLEWIEALLAADDPVVVKALAEQSEEAFAKAWALFDAHLKRLLDAEKYPPAILLAGEAVKQLSSRLTARQRQVLSDVLAGATARQIAADRERVAKLAPQLSAVDESARTAADAELQSMGERAVAPLLEELKKVVIADAPGAEKAILAALAQIAPKLTGYDPAAPKADRIKLVDSWLKG